MTPVVSRSNDVEAVSLPAPPFPPAVPPPPLQKAPAPTGEPTPAFVPPTSDPVGHLPALAHQTLPDTVEVAASVSEPVRHLPGPPAQDMVKGRSIGAAAVPASVPSPAAVPSRRRTVVQAPRDELIEERPIRVGKVQWPPPRAEDRKPEVQVGRLEIEEGEEASLAVSTRPVSGVTGLSRQKMHDRVVIKHQNEAASVSLQPVFVYLLSLIHI